jgi:hypothetical protein
MKKNNLIAIGFGILLLAFGACGSTENKDAATDNAGNEQVMIDTEHAYICPMHCENSASMEPGQCPVCGMDLVKNPDYTGATEAAPADSGAMMEGSHEGHDHSHEGHSH